MPGGGGPGLPGGNPFTGGKKKTKKAVGAAAFFSAKYLKMPGNMYIPALTGGFALIKLALDLCRENRFRRNTVKTRLARGGRIHRPVYIIVAADVRKARDGRFLEKLDSMIQTALKNYQVLKLKRLKRGYRRVL